MPLILVLDNTTTLAECDREPDSLNYRAARSCALISANSGRRRTGTWRRPHDLGRRSQHVIPAAESRPTPQSGASPHPPVIPEVEPRPESRGETIRDLTREVHMTVRSRMASLRRFPG